jgi:hypothetical protein
MTWEVCVIIGLILLCSGVGVRLGIKLGKSIMYKSITEEIRQEIYNNFYKVYFDRLVVEFNNKVEERAHQLVDELVTKIESEENDNEDIGSSGCSE